MNKYKIIQIICWSVVFIVFIGLAIWFASGNTIKGRTTNFGLSTLKLSGPYVEEGRYQVEIDNIKEMDVDWVSGSVTVTPYNGSDITLIEYAQRALEEDEIMEYKVGSGKLKVKFRASNNNKFFDSMPSKKLEVLIPQELADGFSDFVINSVSAPVEISNINSENLEISNVSGSCDLNNINTDRIKINTTSGNINLIDSMSKDITTSSVSGRASIDKVTTDSLSLHSTSGNATIINVISSEVSYDTVSGVFDFDGELKYLNASSTSGEFKVIDRIVPDELDIDTVSGDINVSIPKSEDMQIKYKTISGKFTCDFPVLMNKLSSDYVFSTGSGDINIQELKR